MSGVLHLAYLLCGFSVSPVEPFGVSVRPIDMTHTQAFTIRSHPFTANCECGVYEVFASADAAGDWAYSHEMACGGAAEYWRCG